MWKPLKKFHFLCKAFLLQGHTTSCQGLVMMEEWRISPHKMWAFHFCHHWLYLKIPSSPPSNLCFLCHPTKSCPACRESHIHSQGSKQRMSSSPNTRAARGLQNAHRCALICTISLRWILYQPLWTQRKWDFSLERWKKLTQFGKWQSRYRDPVSGSKAHTFFSLLTCVWPEWLASRACSPIANVKHAGPQSTHLGNTQGSLTCWR